MRPAQRAIFPLRSRVGGQGDLVRDFGRPEWRYTSSLTWRMNEWGAGWFTSYVGDVFDDQIVRSDTSQPWIIEDYQTHNLYVQYELGHDSRRADAASRRRAQSSRTKCRRWPTRSSAISATCTARRAGMSISMCGRRSESERYRAKYSIIASAVAAPSARASAIGIWSQSSTVMPGAFMASSAQPFEVPPVGLWA